MIILFIIFWLGVGGFDWVTDFMDCIFTNINILYEKQTNWEPNFNSYDEWVNSMLKNDPSYGDGEGWLTREDYIEAKYPNLDEIIDDDLLYFIHLELNGFEDNFI